MIDLLVFATILPILCEILLEFATYPIIFATMKFLFSLLGFLMLYVSCLPCSDATGYDAKAEVKISSSSTNQEHKHPNESCTPFCTCSCCAASVFYSPVSKMQGKKIIFQLEKYSPQNITFNSEDHYSIWQPPKLAA